MQIQVDKKLNTSVDRDEVQIQAQIEIQMQAHLQTQTQTQILCKVGTLQQNQLWWSVNLIDFEI